MSKLRAGNDQMWWVINQRFFTIPILSDERITESGELRITENGQTRVTEGDSP